jgi:hypothetical protein
METKHLVNYTYETVESFFLQGVVTQAQWDGYVYVWAHSAPRFSTLAVGVDHNPNLLASDAKVEMWSLFAVLPERAAEHFTARMVELSN